MFRVARDKKLSDYLIIGIEEKERERERERRDKILRRVAKKPSDEDN